MKYSAPPYMHDVLPLAPEKDAWLHSAKWSAVESIFRNTCRDFGYCEIRTPVMESTDLFTRTVGEGTDIVAKEMFTFEDKGGRSMTLRPEGTAPAIRSYVENALWRYNPLQKLYYIATIYRYERGNKGRYREHQQTGVEALGSSDPAIDAEIISLALEFYARLGITDTRLKLNSLGCPICRPAYKQALEAFATPLVSEMSQDNQTRFKINPLRMLDSKDKKDQDLFQNAPRLAEYLCEECSGHLTLVKFYLDNLGISYELNDNLVRGFDYYTKTTFEIVSNSLGPDTAIGGGGRYDGLVKEIGGPDTPGIGFGIGTERCLIVLEQLGIEIPINDARPIAFLVTLGEKAKEVSPTILHTLRKNGIRSDMDYVGKSMKAQMRQADRCGARFACILGDDELANMQISVKPLRGEGAQELVEIARLPEYLKNVG